MRPSAIPVLALCAAVLGCGFSGPASEPATVPPTDTTAAPSDQPYAPKWEALPREDARLRGLVRDTLSALTAKNPARLETLLSGAALDALRTACGGTLRPDCIPAAPQLRVRDIVLDDDTHATILTSRIVEGALEDGPTLHAVLSRLGVTLTDLPQ